MKVSNALLCAALLAPLTIGTAWAQDDYNDLDGEETEKKPTRERKRPEVREIVRGLRTEGRCVVFSSHVMQEVSALCDDVVVMAHGRVAARGSPGDLIASTGQVGLEDAFVALTSTVPPRGAP